MPSWGRLSFPGPRRGDIVPLSLFEGLVDRHRSNVEARANCRKGISRPIGRLVLHHGLRLLRGGLVLEDLDVSLVRSGRDLPIGFVCKLFKLALLPTPS